MRGQSRHDLEREARRIGRRAFKAALATSEAGTGYPYASLVTIATDARGAPLLLLSALALHSRNLLREPRASLLLDESSSLADPLTGARVTITGTIARSDEAATRRRFLARHPAAARLADLGDFAFYRMEVQRGHLIGGFGRILDIAPQGLLLGEDAAAAISAGEAELIEQLGRERGDALAGSIAASAGAAPGRWRFAGIDPEGIDLAAGPAAVRIDFARPVGGIEEARRAICELAGAG